jgi:predicted RNA-binding Zn-ribbon protein involved in translation (DUF1610 family)
MTDSDRAPDPADQTVFHYACPSCDAKLKAPAALAGTSQACPHCEQTIRLPGVALPSGTAPAVSSSLASGQQIPDSARIRLNCPQCGQLIFARGHQLGSSVMCDNCLEDVPVTAASPQQPVDQVEDVSDSVPTAGLVDRSHESDAEISLEPEISLQTDSQPPSVAPTDVADRASGGGQAIRLTADDVATPPPEQTDQPAAAAAAAVAPSEQNYDLDNVDLENLGPTDPPLPSQFSLEGLEQQPAGQSTEQIMAGFQPADGETSDTKQGRPASVVKADAYQFGINCGLCGTRMIVGSQQVGTEVKCPDCHSQTTVRESAEHKRARQASPPESEGALPAIAPAISRSEPEKIDASRREQANKVLEKANLVLDAEDQEHRKLEDRDWWRAILAILGQFDVVLRIVMLSVLLGLAATSIHWANNMPTAAQTLTMGFLLYIAAAVFAAPFLALVSTTVVTIVEQTADGRDDIGDWPGIVSTEWLGTAPYFLVAGLSGAVPLIAWLPLTSGTLPEPLVWSVAALLAGTAAAVVLLSTLSSGTALLIISVPVVSSIPLRSSSWMKFVGFVALWGSGAAGGLALLQSEQLSLILLGGLLLVLFSFLYARTVGVLGYQVARYRDGDLLDSLQDSIDEDTIE